MLERFLERLSVSPYKDYFIIKGGFLIAAMVGLDTRATMDMDFTIKGKPVSLESIRDMISNMCNISLSDGVIFKFSNIEEIRDKDEYNGFRVSLYALYPPMEVPLKLDITTGDVITPKKISYEYHKLLEDGTISVLAYNLVTILAEKIETILSRGDLNTRPRDYYDVYILFTLHRENISCVELKTALINTGIRRKSYDSIKDYVKILDIIRNSETMKMRWQRYQKDFNYAKDIDFEEVCNSLLNILVDIGV